MYQWQADAFKNWFGKEQRGPLRGCRSFRVHSEGHYRVGQRSHTTEFKLFEPQRKIGGVKNRKNSSEPSGFRIFVFLSCSRSRISIEKGSRSEYVFFRES